MYFGKQTVFLFGGGCAWTIPPPNAVKIHRFRLIKPYFSLFAPNKA